ncbi:hypothetical protein PsorP6_015613 [Peronosclerospora sorghi]|uniref:Uncharacterized protein n=1 Tax=Peronosclerospora sorghi TaxID=230839 RepID=A0ACC0WPR0_9STRA|nr:hypothetical protein PsorP6_015613 [Peronosclerospora sorghi]
MKIVVDVFALEKYVPHLIECFNSSKNMKSRCECIDLVEWMSRDGRGKRFVSLSAFVTGIWLGSASTTASATPKTTAKEQQVESVQGDDDVDMSSPPDEVEKKTSCPSQSIEDLLLRRVAELVEASSKEMVAAGSQAYKEDGNALKGLYEILTRPSVPSEVAFLHWYVNEIVLALCECLHVKLSRVCSGTRSSACCWNCARS